MRSEQDWPLRQRMWPAAKLILVVIAGLALGPSAAGLLETSSYAFRKATGKGSACSWGQTLEMRKSRLVSGRLVEQIEGDSRIIESDESLGIVRVHSAERDFWVRKAGTFLGGRKLISYLLVEHRWMEEMNPADQVRKGDIVIDCGAHVGVFCHFALKLGAAKVVAVEPNPQTLECLRRNFVKEIADGRLVIVPKGVWSSATTLKLWTSEQNSGMNSVLLKDGDRAVEVPLVTLDSIVEGLGLPRVDYIKMDIEGAEREALAGARETLRRWKPRLMLDYYHRPDDAQVLPQVIAAARPDYSEDCGPCQEVEAGRIVPHVMYLR